MTESYDRGMQSSRTINLVGALGIALADGQTRAMREASGLADTEVAALNVIGFGGGPSIVDVRAALSLTHPGTVRVVDRLVARDLVVRVPGTDGRKVGLVLTPEGRVVFEGSARARADWLGPFAALLRTHVGPGVDTMLEQLLVLVGGTEDDGEHLCRLCDDRVCPQDRCPVTLAVGKGP
jgi:MarR family transcriptional repressor of emrRAB